MTPQPLTRFANPACVTRNAIVELPAFGRAVWLLATAWTTPGGPLGVSQFAGTVRIAVGVSPGSDLCGN